MAPLTGKQYNTYTHTQVTIHILHNMFRSKYNQTMKFSQLIEYIVRISQDFFLFLENLYMR